MSHKSFFDIVHQLTVLHDARAKAFAAEKVEPQKPHPLYLDFLEHEEEMRANDLDAQRVG